MKVAVGQTPQPSPNFHSAVERLQQGEFVGTPERLSTLRGACLIRDRHRCVITRKFDYLEAQKRSKDDQDALDDDGEPLTPSLAILEVAHILPHSLMALSKGSAQLVYTFLETIGYLELKTNRPKTK